MASNLDKYRQDLEKLLKAGEELLLNLLEVAQGRKGEEGKAASGSKFIVGYQRWYSEAHEVVRQILPNRLTEFEKLYEGDKRKTINSETYTIQDWLLGRRAPLSMNMEVSMMRVLFR